MRKSISNLLDIICGTTHTNLMVVCLFLRATIIPAWTQMTLGALYNGSGTLCLT
jgi:hypothetical protein